jgi:carbon monoxide dehydrogenase subunit G
VPAATIQFRVPAPVARLRTLLADPTFVASKIPQVIAVEKTSATTARWTVRIKIGPIARTSLYEGELVEQTDAGVRFRAKGPESVIEGHLEFRPDPPEGTGVTLTLTMTGLGPLRAVVDAYLSKRVKDDASQFATALSEHLASSEGPGA